jgi:hypothetical protein
MTLFFADILTDFRRLPFPFEQRGFNNHNFGNLSFPYIDRN